MHPFSLFCLSCLPVGNQNDGWKVMFTSSIYLGATPSVDKCPARNLQCASKVRMKVPLALIFHPGCLSRGNTIVRFLADRPFGTRSVLLESTFEGKWGVETSVSLVVFLRHTLKLFRGCSSSCSVCFLWGAFDVFLPWGWAWWKPFQPGAPMICPFTACLTFMLSIPSL